MEVFLDVVKTSMPSLMVGPEERNSGCMYWLRLLSQSRVM